MGCVLSCVQPCVPCLFACFVGCNGGVIWKIPEFDHEDRRTVALTIDDFPQPGMTPMRLLAVLEKLDEYASYVTFFVILSNLKAHKDGEKMLRMIVESGHEIGLHWKGRWGCLKPRHEFLSEAFELKHGIERRHGTSIQFCRPPGGFATSATIQELKRRASLTTVIGTAYSGDADVCASRSPRWQGVAAANMAMDGGAIAILHDDEFLLEKIQAFVDQASFVGLAPSQTLSASITGMPPGLGGYARPLPALLI